jgi:hypothetical protein
MRKRAGPAGVSVFALCVCSCAAAHLAAERHPLVVAPHGERGDVGAHGNVRRQAGSCADTRLLERVTTKLSEQSNPPCAHAARIAARAHRRTRLWQLQVRAQRGQHGALVCSAVSGQRC